MQRRTVEVKQERPTLVIPRGRGTIENRWGVPLNRLDAKDLVVGIGRVRHVDGLVSTRLVDAGRWLAREERVAGLSTGVQHRWHHQRNSGLALRVAPHLHVARRIAIDLRLLLRRQYCNLWRREITGVGLTDHDDHRLLNVDAVLLHLCDRRRVKCLRVRVAAKRLCNRCGRLFGALRRAVVVDRGVQVLNQRIAGAVCGLPAIFDQLPRRIGGRSRRAVAVADLDANRCCVVLGLDDRGLRVLPHVAVRDRLPRLHVGVEELVNRGLHGLRRRLKLARVGRRARDIIEPHLERVASRNAPDQTTVLEQRARIGRLLVRAEDLEVVAHDRDQFDDPRREAPAIDTLLELPHKRLLTCESHKV